MRYFLPSVSFFCPAYNDEHNLPILIPRVYKFLSSITKKFEIIIIEDGSPDQTSEAADVLARKYSHIKVIHHKINMGYGAALKDGFKNARFEYVIYTDGDNQYDIRECAPFLHLLSDSTDILSGYALKKAVTQSRKIQSTVYNWVIFLLFFIKIKDIDCALKIYKKSVLKSIDIKSDSAFIDAEMLIKAKRRGFRITQFPVTHFERKTGPAGGSNPNLIFYTIKDMILFRLGFL